MRLNNLFLTVVVICLCLLVSCVKEGKKIDMKTSPSDKSIVELVSKKYEDAQLTDIIEFSGSVKELDAAYTIECVRKCGEDYRVSYLGEGSVAIVLFDGYGKKMMSEICTTNLYRSDFDNLSIGNTLKEVRALDSEGQYLFLYTGTNVPRQSYHYTEDGYYITIDYDYSNTIVNINVEFI